MIGAIFLIFIIGVAILIWVEVESRRQAIFTMMVLDRRTLMVKYVKYKQAYNEYYHEGRYSIEYLEYAENNLREFVKYYNEKYSKYTEGININDLLIKE